MITFIRRRKLGRGSTKGIMSYMQTPVTTVRNDLMHKYPENTELCVRWGCTSNVLTNNVLNTASAIHQVNDKIAFRRLLQPHGLCPKTWFEEDDLETIQYPVIIRAERHAQGRHLYVANNVSDLRNIVVRNFNNQRVYASKLINKVAEYRVFVGCGRAVWVAQKTPGNPQDVAWNVAQGGRFNNVRFNDWPLKVVKTAIEAFNLTDLHFGGVDVIVDENNNAYVLEINSAPSQTSPYRQECVAKFIDYTYQNGKQRISLINEKGGYLKFIHPAIDNKAKLIK
jgi:glutathione synthase/RimK-type ligase-like ATP-grasp enzyme